MRCLVLGANGFIGTNLCLALAAAGAKVRGTGRSIEPRPELQDQIEWVQFNFKSKTCFAREVEGADVVVHLISTLLPAASNVDKTRDIEENLLTTVHLLDACKQAGVSKVVFASSGGTVYGVQEVMPISEECPTLPISSYGIVKVAIENYLHLYRHLHSLDFVALRIANPFGCYQMPHDQGLVAALMGKALKGSTIDIWGNGSTIRDYLFVSDLVAAIISAIELTDPSAPRIYNIGSGVGRSVNEVLQAICEIHGKALDVRYHSARALDVPVNILDIQRAREFLGWSPRFDWRCSLDLTYRWLYNLYA